MSCSYVIKFIPTLRFLVLDIEMVASDTVLVHRNFGCHYELDVCYNCEYTTKVVRQAAQRRSWCTVLTSIEPIGQNRRIQLGEFENIHWEDILSAKASCNSYLVRKGLSRKAQLSFQLKRYLSKHPKSVLKQAIPFTLIIDTWSAYEEMRLDFGGGIFATFDALEVIQIPLRQKLEWCLEDVKAEVTKTERHEWCWILKPSVTNKGIDIHLIKQWEEFIIILESHQNIREWVLQRYIERPLLVSGGYKFHCRVYVLCLGALQVFVFDRMLMLLAAHK